MSDSLITAFIFGALLLGIFAGIAAHIEWSENKNKKNNIRESRYPPRIYTQSIVQNNKISRGARKAKIVNRKGRN
jgi:phosphoglycerate-specific signal transduction histidine kinase